MVFAERSVVGQAIALGLFRPAAVVLVDVGHGHETIVGLLDHLPAGRAEVVVDEHVAQDLGGLRARRHAGDAEHQSQGERERVFHG